MITPLIGTLRRAIHVNGHEYTAVLTPTGIKLTPKGKRKGVEFAWLDLLGGQQSGHPRSALSSWGTGVSQEPGL